jgi:hypothetical protein
VLVGGALVGRGGLVADKRGPRVEGERLQARVDDRAVIGQAAHHRRPHEEARLEGLGRGAVAVKVAAVIGVHEDVRAALQFGVDAAAVSNSKVPVPAPVTVGHSMSWRASRSRVCLCLSVAPAIAWRRSSQPRRCCAEPWSVDVKTAYLWITLGGSRFDSKVLNQSRACCKLAHRSASGARPPFDSQ